MEFGSNDINAEAGDLISRFELAKNDILAEFALINTDNGYRTASVKVVPAIRRRDLIVQQLTTGEAEIGVYLGNSKTKGIGNAWSSYESNVDVWVQAVIKTQSVSNDDSLLLNEALEGLRHDLLRVCAILVKKYLNDYKGRWNLLPVPIEAVVSADLGDKNSLGAVGLKFQIQLRAMDGTFK
jgi:hypothetical protein